VCSSLVTPSLRRPPLLLSEMFDPPSLASWFPPVAVLTGFPRLFLFQYLFLTFFGFSEAHPFPCPAAPDGTRLTDGGTDFSFYAAFVVPSPFWPVRWDSLRSLSKFLRRACPRLFFRVLHLFPPSSPAPWPEPQIYVFFFLNFRTLS